MPRSSLLPPDEPTTSNAIGPTASTQSEEIAAKQKSALQEA
ncbi:MAG: hypothetical protein ACLPGW_05280 [Roseiarcus sp.]